jgi:hypothetical protein
MLLEPQHPTTRPRHLLLLPPTPRTGSGIGVAGPGQIAGAERGAVSPPPPPPLNPKKLFCGNGPDRVFILFNPSDDASIGDTCERGSADLASFFSLDPEPETDIEDERVEF